MTDTPHWRWYQFSLWRLLALTGLVALALGAWRNEGTTAGEVMIHVLAMIVLLTVLPLLRRTLFWVYGRLFVRDNEGG